MQTNAIVLEANAAATVTQTTLSKLLSFTVDGTVYAIDALRIKEIIEYSSVTRIPMVPNYIRGVTNLRGSVVPVIDLAARLGKRPSPITRRTSIIIIEVVDEGDKIDLGVVIDAINEVCNIEQREIQQPPNFGAGIPSKYISGMVKLGERFVILLNTDFVLSISELSQLYGVAIISNGVTSQVSDVDATKPA